MVTTYQMAVTNTAAFIRSPENREKTEEVVFDAFTASVVLAVAFCKAKEEVLMDLVNVKL